MRLLAAVCVLLKLAQALGGQGEDGLCAPAPEALDAGAHGERSAGATSCSSGFKLQGSAAAAARCSSLLAPPVCCCHRNCCCCWLHFTANSASRPAPANQPSFETHSSLARALGTLLPKRPPKPRWRKPSPAGQRQPPWSGAAGACRRCWLVRSRRCRFAAQRRTRPGSGSAAHGARPSPIDCQLCR